MMKSKLWLVGAVGAVAMSSAAMASVVVVRSLGPSAKSYPPGKTLPESAKISLGAGDVVTLLGPSKAQTLRGPGNFSASNISLADASNKRGRFGALRAGEVARNPSVWDIDATQSGKVCVGSNANVLLWRPDTEAEATVNIRAADGNVAPVTWVAGNAAAGWPGALPLTSGSEYQIEWQDTGEKSNITIVRVENAPSDLPGAAQLLIQNECQNQLDVLVDGAVKLGN